MGKYELAELDYKNGMKYKEIADKYEISLNTVKSWKQRYKWCKDDKKGAPKTKKVAPKKIKEVAKALIEEGHTLSEVANQTELHPSTLKRMSSKENLQQSQLEYLKQFREKYKEKVVKEKIIETLADRGLTDKQRLFCTYYIENFNATQSAIKAGYSKKTARTIGYENLTKPYIKSYIKEIKKIRFQIEYLETKRILERHKQIAFSDIKDFVEFEMSVDNTGVKRWLFKIKADCEVDGTLIKKIRYSSNGSVIELEDRYKSLSFLTRFYGLDIRTELEKTKLDIQSRLKVIELEVKNGGITTETDSKEVEEDLEKWTKEAWK